MAGALPDWTTDERILALDLYLRRGLAGESDPELVESSSLLRSLPIHEPRPTSPSFRNPHGVYWKLTCFAALDPAYPGGASNYSSGDVEVWDRYGNEPAFVRRLAVAIRQAARDKTLAPTDEPEETEVSEGAILYRQHRSRERNRPIVERAKASALKRTGKLACEVCGFDFAVAYGDRGRGYIECHHIVPLSELGPRRTRVSDLVLLCANCHRMAHRRKPWPSLDDLKDLWTGHFADGLGAQ